MKTPTLFAFCAAASALTAVDHPDPAEIARDWIKTVATARAAVTTDLSLKALSVRGSAAVATIRDSADFSTEPKPEEQLYGAPAYRVPRVLPDSRPPGAKPWQFGGQTYWLVPLGPAGRNR